MTRARPRVYLAGPEVFLPDARAAGRRKQALCDAHGLDGIYPLDAELTASDLTKNATAHAISAANEALMRSCNALIANLTPFRGVSADAGTAFEVGFMRALGRPVFGYSTSARLYHARAMVYRSAARLAFDADAAAVAIEDFDMTDNLMIVAAIEASGSRVFVAEAAIGCEMTALDAFEACLRDAARLLGR